MKTVIFQVQQNYDLPFKTGKNYSLDNLVNIDWNSDNNLRLTQLLNQEIIKNYIWYKLVDKYCSYPKYYEWGNSIPILKKGEGFIEYIINKDICKFFYKSSYAYIDLFNRDEKAMNRNRYQDNLYAIVLLKDNNYMGHVYAWLSPSKEYGFMMGIRSNILTNYNLISQTKGLSYYLIDAVRKFFISKNIDNFVFPYPIGGMEDKLKTLGFEYTSIDGKDIGNSTIMSKGSPCDRCMLKRGVKNWDFKTKKSNNIIIIY